MLRQLALSVEIASAGVAPELICVWTGITSCNDVGRIIPESARDGLRSTTGPKFRARSSQLFGGGVFAGLVGGLEIRADRVDVGHILVVGV